MCGIFCYIGPRNSVKICIDGLRHLEYRGYDSAGIAGISDGEIVCYKKVGKISALEELITPFLAGTKPLELQSAISHTRWATHGKPTTENAHPHFDQQGKVAVVHNGIIENHRAVRKMLEDKGVVFQSDTDSEVIAQLIAHLYEGDLLAAVQKTVPLLEGFFGIAIIHKDHPDEIIATARENPLAIAFHPLRNESLISSDANAFTDKDLDVLFLRNDEIAQVKADHVQLFDASCSPIVKEVKKLEFETVAISKNGFEHFMLKEIFEQPQTIQQAFHMRLSEEAGTAAFENLSFSTKELLATKRILILGCGTSWHAGSVAASLFEELARIPTPAEIASEFRYKNPIISEDTLVLAISQSGETFDTLAAVREVKSKGARVIGICNVRNSSLTREADDCLFLRAGPEVSVVSTKAFTSQLTLLSLFALMMARLRHMGKEEGQKFLHELQLLPEKVHQILLQKEKIDTLALTYAHFENFFFLGRHYMYTTALEAALKLKETSYRNAIGYPAGEMKHGPIALVCKDLAVVALLGNQHTYEKTLSNLMEVKARSAKILAFAPRGASGIESIADDIFLLPEISDPLAPILYSVALQLFAYSIAKIRGTEIDQPRNLAKSVTVE